jgi:hypothetical protein
MKSYSILVILCLIAFMVCNSQFISRIKKTNLRALRPTTLVTTRTTTRHTTIINSDNIMK